MSIPTQFDQYGEFERSLNVEMLQAQIFGAVFAAVEYRKANVNLTNIEIARRSGWSRSHVTKIMAHPQNWTIETISKMATALDLEFRFFLVDRTDPSKGFDANGLVYDAVKIPPSRKGMKRRIQVMRSDVQVQSFTNFDLIQNLSSPLQNSQTETMQNAKQPVSVYSDIGYTLSVGGGQ